jgi:hypothetical protein
MLTIPKKGVPIAEIEPATFRLQSGCSKINRLRIPAGKQNYYKCKVETEALFLALKKSRSYRELNPDPQDQNLMC